MPLHAAASFLHAFGVWIVAEGSLHVVTSADECFKDVGALCLTHTRSVEAYPEQVSQVAEDVKHDDKDAADVWGACSQGHIFELVSLVISGKDWQGLSPIFCVIVEAGELCIDREKAHNVKNEGDERDDWVD